MKNAISVGLIILIGLSWALYPWAVSWVYPSLVRITFATGFAFVIGWLFLDGGKSKEKTIDGWEKLLFFAWAGYLLCILVASFVFNNVNPDLILRYLLKSIFFLVLFFYLNKQTIFMSFDIYANLCIALVALSMITIIGISLGWVNVQPISVTRGINNYGEMGFTFSGFDGNARVFAETSRFMRMQSFAIEPGAFGLALLPALYWLTLVRKHFLKATVIMFGITASWSLGALLAMILALLVLYGNKSVERFGKFLLFSGAVFFVFSHAVLVSLESSSIESSSMVAGDRSLSLNQRWEELSQVKEFILKYPWGAGIGAGREAMSSSISVGYANVFADTGILGGSIYLLVFLILGYEATKGALGKLGNISDVKVANSIVAMGLSVLTCLFFGLQREQPDASYWHMWIYASFFSMYGIARLNNCSTK